MNGITITRTRRRIANMIDALHRLDNARLHPGLSQSLHSRRMRELQAAQREEIFDVFDKLVEAHRVLDRTKAELEGAQAANKKLHEELADVKLRYSRYKTAMYGIVYGAPSCVMAGVNGDSDGVCQANLRACREAGFTEQNAQVVSQLREPIGSAKPSTLTPSGGIYKYNPDSPSLETNEPQVAGCDQNVEAKQARRDEYAYPYVVYRRGDAWRVMDVRTGNTHLTAYATNGAALHAARIYKCEDAAGEGLHIGKDGQFTKNPANW